MHSLIRCPIQAEGERKLLPVPRRTGQQPRLRPPCSYRFLAFVFFFGAAFFAGCFGAGLAGGFLDLGAALTGFALAAGFDLTSDFALTSGLATRAATAAGCCTATDAAFPLPLATSPFLPGTAAGGTAAAAFGPRPRLGGGGGGGGGGANGFRNFQVSVGERSLPSRSRMHTSRAIFGYSGSDGVISNSVISGSGIRCCTCRHLVRKFLIFPATV